MPAFPSDTLTDQPTAVLDSPAQAEPASPAPNEPDNPQAAADAADLADRAMFDKLNAASEAIGSAELEDVVSEGAPAAEPEKTPEPEKAPESGKASEPTEDPKAAEPEKKEGDQPTAQPDFEAIAKDPGVAKHAEALEVKADALLEVAIRAYKRDGYFDEDELVQRFHADNTRFIELGLQRATRQKDQDTYGNDYRKDRDEFEAWRKAREGGSDRGMEAPAAPVAPVESRPLPEKASEILAKIKSDEYLGDLAEPLQGLMDTMKAEGDARVAALSAQLNSIREQNVDSQLQGAKENLKGDFPKLADDVVYAKVLERYDVIVSAGKADTVAHGLAEAAKWELGSPTSPQKPPEDLTALTQRLMATTAKRKAGQPTARAVRSDTPALTEDQQDRLIFDKLRRKEYGPEL